MTASLRRAPSRRLLGLILAGTIAAAMLATPARAVSGVLTLASTSDTGVKGNGISEFADLSADGTKVAFRSFATNLDPADTDSIADIYVKNLTTGDLTLASMGSAKSNGNSFDPFLSADGTKVAFWSEATNLDPADTDSGYDVYVKDLTTGDLTLASTNASGTKGNMPSAFPTLSPDGNLVSFQSLATNFDPSDTDSFTDIYVKDLTSGALTLVSEKSPGIKANDNSFNGNLSSDGTHVSFETVATNLDPTDTDSSSDIYVKDLAGGGLSLASTSDSGTKGNDTSTLATSSVDGRMVAFRSLATNLDGNDGDALSDVYVKDLKFGDITLASTDDSGAKGDGNSLSPTLSTDARRVAFRSSSTNLDPADPDTINDVYVKDLATGDTILASTNGTGTKGNGDSFWPSLSANGAAVAFDSSASNLVPADLDTIKDVYVKDLGTPPAASADMSITKSDSPDPVVVGHTLTYTLAVTNAGPDQAADVIVDDQLPPGITVDSLTPSQGSCFTPSGAVHCELGAVPSGTTTFVAIRVTPGSPGTITNSASVSASTPDPDHANNADSEDTTVAPAGGQADLRLTKAASRVHMRVRQALKYTIRVRNRGPNSATGIEMTDALPAGVSFDSAVPAQGACSQASGTVTCNLGTLANGASTVVKIRVHPQNQATISNTARVSADQPDPDTTNNQDTVTTQVN